MSFNESVQDLIDVDEWQSRLDRYVQLVCKCFSIDDELHATLSFVGDDEMAEINLRERGKNQTTDVLSFPLLSFPVGPGPQTLATTRVREILHEFPIAPGVPIELGDILISPAVAVAQATEIGHSVEDELQRLLVHGLLHLFGFDHETSEKDARSMQEHEDWLLEA